MTDQTWAPTLSNLENPDQGYSVVARGLAGVAENVQTMRHYPWATIEDEENRIRGEMGAHWTNSTWSLEQHAKGASEALGEKHWTLRRLLVLLAHAYELSRQHPQDSSYVRAFLRRSDKAGVEAARSAGSWQNSWPLTGLPEADHGAYRTGGVSSAAEREKDARGVPRSQREVGGRLKSSSSLTDLHANTLKSGSPLTNLHANTQKGPILSSESDGSEPLVPKGSQVEPTGSQREPKGSRREPKGSQKGSEREPKGTRKGAKGSQKGTKREPKERRPKKYRNMMSKWSQNASRNPFKIYQNMDAEKKRENEAKKTPKN